MTYNESKDVEVVQYEVKHKKYHQDGKGDYVAPVCKIVGICSLRWEILLNVLIRKR